jgi:AcrR family transcriptional regulator
MCQYLAEAMTTPRIRRTPEAAREAILEVAEQHLSDRGFDALRLQDVAAAAGMSHPTVLHHFGSRDGLVRAVVERAVVALQEDLLGAFGSTPPDGAALLERVAQTFAGRRHARTIAWLLLSGHNPIDGPAMKAGWRAIAKATHVMRDKTATFEDTQFTVMLSCLAVFAQAIAGPALFETAGLPTDAATARRFRMWLAELLAQHLATADAKRQRR